MAPVLFNLAWNICIIRKISVGPKETLLNKPVQIVGYADDVNIMVRSQLNAKEIYKDLEKVVNEVALRSMKTRQKL